MGKPTEIVESDPVGTVSPKKSRTGFLGRGRSSNVRYNLPTASISFGWKNTSACGAVAGNPPSVHRVKNRIPPGTGDVKPHAEIITACVLARWDRPKTHGLCGGSLGLVWFWMWVNDPSAGSPTETLLRLHLPLNDKVQASFRHQPTIKRTSCNPEASPDHSIGRCDGRCVQRAGT